MHASRFLRLAALTAAIGISNVASSAAADLALKAPVAATPYSKSWDGFYLGAYVGYGINTTTAIVNQAPLVVNIGDAPRGFLGGGIVGADWQVAPTFVLGVFANAGIANLNAHGAFTVADVQMLGVGNATNYIGAVGARAGYLISPDNLAYAKGGFAFGGAKPDFAAIGTAKSISDTSTGWMAGAGMEHRFSQNKNVSIFLEGTYTRLGDKTLTIAQAMTSMAKYHIVEQKVGLQYRF